jgi:hypothetical protein
VNQAGRRWLRPHEIHAILCNYKHFSVNSNPVNLPKSNYLLPISINCNMIDTRLNSGIISYVIMQFLESFHKLIQKWMISITSDIVLCLFWLLNVTGGTVVLFDRKMLRNFRKDGHKWKKKKDGKNVNESHERLKVRFSQFLICYSGINLCVCN